MAKMTYRTLKESSLTAFGMAKSSFRMAKTPSETSNSGNFPMFWQKTTIFALKRPDQRLPCPRPRTAPNAELTSFKIPTSFPA